MEPDPGDAPVARPARPFDVARATDTARWQFLSAALRNPGQIGAVTPSSAQLAALLAAVVPRAGAPVVVELGPGTGSVSAAIDARLPAGARHLAVELDPVMARYLRRTRPGLEVVEADVADLAALLVERGVAHVDAIVSGLPWALFDVQTQQSVLTQVGAALGPHGVFASFGYVHALPMPAARRFRDTLREMFDEVMATRTVWRNLPPAFAYVCRRPAAV